MTAPAMAAGMGEPRKPARHPQGPERLDPVRQNRSKLTETASQALSTAPIPVGGKAVNGVILVVESAPRAYRPKASNAAPAYFNIPGGNSLSIAKVIL